MPDKPETKPSETKPTTETAKSPVKPALAMVEPANPTEALLKAIDEAYETVRQVALLQQQGMQPGKAQTRRAGFGNSQQNWNLEEEVTGRHNQFREVDPEEVRTRNETYLLERRVDLDMRKSREMPLEDIIKARSQQTTSLLDR